MTRNSGHGRTNPFKGFGPEFLKNSATAPCKQDQT